VTRECAHRCAAVGSTDETGGFERKEGVDAPDYSGSDIDVRISRARHIACNAAETTCVALARCPSSGALASSSSACARMTPSWLFSRWMSDRRSSAPGCDACSVMALAVGTCGRRPPGSSCGTGGRWSIAVRLTPQGVYEDTNAAAGGADVLDLARGNPVVDGPAADADQLTRFHDAYSLTFHVPASWHESLALRPFTTGHSGRHPRGALTSAFKVNYRFLPAWD